MESWHRTLRQARDMLITAQERQKEYADKKRCEVEFEKGDKVLLSSKNITSQVNKLRPTPKLSPQIYWTLQDYCKTLTSRLSARIAKYSENSPSISCFIVEKI